MAPVLNCEVQSAVGAVEAVGGAGVEAIGAIEAFDELFEGAPAGGLVIAVFEAEDLVEGEGGREGLGEGHRSWSREK